ncbi:MAG TPA: hypothetical protein VJM33_18090, partial [Microthrixaceae bacterium]|nr:hypothetical protein [Microthrixaceae bacterium]
MRHRRQVRLTVAGAVIAIALVAGGCTNPAPPGGNSVALHVLQLTSLKQNETFPTQWWEQPPFAPYDVDDEPYLVHMGIRIKLNEPIRI